MATESSPAPWRMPWRSRERQRRGVAAPARGRGRRRAVDATGGGRPPCIGGNRGRLEAVQYLLQRGASVDVPDNSRPPPSMRGDKATRRSPGAGLHGADPRLTRCRYTPLQGRSNGPWGGDRGCDRGGAEGQGRRTGALLPIAAIAQRSPHDYTCAHHGHAAPPFPPFMRRPYTTTYIARKRAMHRPPFLRAYLLRGYIRSVALACRQSPPLPASQLLQRCIPMHLQSSSSSPSSSAAAPSSPLLFLLLYLRRLLPYNRSGVLSYPIALFCGGSSSSRHIAHTYSYPHHQRYSHS